MHQLVPPLRPSEIDVAELVGAEARSHPDGTPWVFANMVTTIDGAATVDGRSGDLGGPGDRDLFTALRAEADVIVVGAQTVRDERYRLARSPGDVGRRLRQERGQGERPRLCIVTRAATLTGAPPLLDELPTIGEVGAPWERPLVATVRHPDGTPTFDDRFDVLELGDESVDLAGLVTELGRRGLPRILCEGGPSLLAQLGAAGLVDEWNFTIAPIVQAGDSIRPVHSTEPLGHRLRLTRLFAHDDGTLFARYLT